MIKYLLITVLVISFGHSIKYYNKLQSADKRIIHMLMDPMFMFGDKLIHDVSEFNDSVMNLVSALRSGTPDGIKNSKHFYRKGEPQFINFKYDAFIVKTKFGWTESELRQFIKLREKTKQIFIYFCKIVEELAIFEDQSGKLLNE